MSTSKPCARKTSYEAGIFHRHIYAEYGDLIDELFDENRVHVNGIVLIELLTGANNQAEFDRLGLALASLKIVQSDRKSFQSAGRNGFALKKKGISVPLSDVIIATDCIDHSLVLIESDKHFTAIAAHIPLQRHPPPTK